MRRRGRRIRGETTTQDCSDEAASRASTETCLCAWDTYLAETAPRFFSSLSLFVSMDPGIYTGWPDAITLVIHRKKIFYVELNSFRKDVFCDVASSFRQREDR